MMFRKFFITAGVAAVAAVGIAGSAQAYEAPAGQLGKYVGTPVVNVEKGTTTKIEPVYMNVQLNDGSEWYHEFEYINASPGPDGVILFECFSNQVDSGG